MAPGVSRKREIIDSGQVLGSQSSGAARAGFSPGSGREPGACSGAEAISGYEDKLGEVWLFARHDSGHRQKMAIFRSHFENNIALTEILFSK